MVAAVRSRAAKIERATELRAEGLSYREIAHMVACHQSTVQGWLNSSTMARKRTTRKRRVQRQAALMPPSPPRVHVAGPKDGTPYEKFLAQYRLRPKSDFL